MLLNSILEYCWQIDGNKMIFLVSIRPKTNKTSRLTFIVSAVFYETVFYTQYNYG